MELSRGIRPTAECTNGPVAGSRAKSPAVCMLFSRRIWPTPECTNGPAAGSRAKAPAGCIWNSRVEFGRRQSAQTDPRRAHGRKLPRDVCVTFASNWIRIAIWRGPLPAGANLVAFQLEIILETHHFGGGRRIRLARSGSPGPELEQGRRQEYSTGAC